MHPTLVHSTLVQIRQKTWKSRTEWNPEAEKIAHFLLIKNYFEDIVFVWLTSIFELLTYKNGTFSDSSGSVGKQFLPGRISCDSIWEFFREIMSESNLAYNNDGSMNTSADYLGKFLQYIYNDFAVEKRPIGQSGQLRSF